MTCKQRYRTLLSQLVHKGTLLRQYLAFSRQILQNLQGGENVRFESLLWQRQGCIRQIEGIDAVLAPAAGAGDVIDDRIDEARKVIQQLLDELRGVDRDLMAAVVTEHRDLRTGLLNMRHGRQAARGYHGGGPRPPRFIDTSY